MSVPIQLADGYVLLYNIDITRSFDLVSVSNPPCKWGSIYAIGYNVNTVFNGEQVLYNPSDAFCQLTWDRRIYLVIEEARLAGIDRIMP